MPTARASRRKRAPRAFHRRTIRQCPGSWCRASPSGPDPMGWLGTMILGIVGSFVGGTLAALVFGGTLELSASGIVGSIVGAIIVLLIWRAMGGRRGVVA